MMMRGATSSCLFFLICYIAAEGDSNSTNAGTETSTSRSSTLTDSTLLSPSNPTSVGPTSVTTIQSTASSTANGNTTSASDSSTGSVYTTSAVGSSPTGGLMSSTSASNTSLLTVTPTNLTFHETSTSDKMNTSTVETMTPTLNSTIVATSSNVNQTSTVVNVTTSMNTTRPTNVTDDVTQASTFKPTNTATTPASGNSTTASGPTNITVPTTVYTTDTTVIVTANTTLSSRPATSVPVNVTVTVNVTVPVNTTTLSTNIPSSSWSTESPRNSTTLSTAPCQSAICPSGSKCVNLYRSYTCRCPLGQYIRQSNCVTVRSFPGTLHLLSVTFTPAMNEVNTKAFSETATKIEREMRRFFKNDPYYYESLVLKLENGSVKAFVDNIFSSSSNVTEESVIQNIRTGIKDCSNCTTITPSDSYTSGSLCTSNFCDAKTSKCRANNGIRECGCLPGYYKFAVSDRSCKACPSGLKLQNGACVKCPFGYGGFNCNKSYLLALVVVSCVLGGILLLLLLALMGTCLRLRSGAYSSSSGSHDYVMWPKAEMPKIPRATMHWDGNQLEMQENGSTSSLTDIHRDGGRMPEKNDDLKTFKGKQQSHYNYLCQGQENPYYVSDEKKPEYL